MRFTSIALALLISGLSLGASLAQTAQPSAPAKATPPAIAKPMAPAAPSAVTPMDINSASGKELATLKGIGDKRSEAIVKGRPYKGKDDLVRKGIVPQAVYDDIKDQIIAKQK